MPDLNSSHGGTFSEGIPSIKIEQSIDILEKCPNCESYNCIDNKCLNCGLGYDGELLNAIIKPKKEVKEIIKIYDDPYDSIKKGYEEDRKYF